MYRRRSFLSAKANPLKSTALVTVKTVALTPMPTASIVTATAVKPGFLTRVRKLNRMSPNKGIGA